MNKLFLLSFLFISLATGLAKTQSSSLLKPTGRTGNAGTVIYPDTTITLFADSSYTLTLRIFDTANRYEAERNNAVLTFSRQNRNQTKIFFRDSLFCMYPGIGFKDFNNDNVKDIILFYYTGARANETYHLYVTDKRSHKLIRVKGFEELPNPMLDTTNNIITSIVFFITVCLVNCGLKIIRFLRREKRFLNRSVFPMMQLLPFHNNKCLNLFRN